jgi:hypothetical protein
MPFELRDRCGVNQRVLARVHVIIGAVTVFHASDTQEPDVAADVGEEAFNAHLPQERQHAVGVTWK